MSTSPIEKLTKSGQPESEMTSMLRAAIRKGEPQKAAYALGHLLLDDTKYSHAADTLLLAAAEDTCMWGMWPLSLKKLYEAVAKCKATADANKKKKKDSEDGENDDGEGVKEAKANVTTAFCKTLLFLTSVRHDRTAANMTFATLCNPDLGAVVPPTEKVEDGDGKVEGEEHRGSYGPLFAELSRAVVPMLAEAVVCLEKVKDSDEISPKPVTAAHVKLTRLMKTVYDALLYNTATTAADSKKLAEKAWDAVEACARAVYSKSADSPAELFKNVSDSVKDLRRLFFAFYSKARKNDYLKRLLWMSAAVFIVRGPQMDWDVPKVSIKEDKVVTPQVTRICASVEEGNPWECVEKEPIDVAYLSPLTTNRFGRSFLVTFANYLESVKEDYPDMYAAIKDMSADEKKARYGPLPAKDTWTAWGEYHTTANALANPHFKVADVKKRPFTQSVLTLAATQQAQLLEREDLKARRDAGKALERKDLPDPERLNAAALEEKGVAAYEELWGIRIAANPTSHWQKKKKTSSSSKKKKEAEEDDGDDDDDGEDKKTTTKRKRASPKKEEKKEKAVVVDDDDEDDEAEKKRAKKRQRTEPAAAAADAPAPRSRTPATPRRKTPATPTTTTTSSSSSSASVSDAAFNDFLTSARANRIGRSPDQDSVIKAMSMNDIATGTQIRLTATNNEDAIMTLPLVYRSPDADLTARGTALYAHDMFATAGPYTSKDSKLNFWHAMDAVRLCKAAGVKTLDIAFVCEELHAVPTFPDKRYFIGYHPPYTPTALKAAPPCKEKGSICLQDPAGAERLSTIASGKEGVEALKKRVISQDVQLMDLLRALFLRAVIARPCRSSLENFVLAGGHVYAIGWDARVSTHGEIYDPPTWAQAVFAGPLPDGLETAMTAAIQSHSKVVTAAMNHIKAVLPVADIHTRRWNVLQDLLNQCMKTSSAPPVPPQPAGSSSSSSAKASSANGVHANGDVSMGVASDVDEVGDTAAAAAAATTTTATLSTPTKTPATRPADDDDDIPM